MVLQLTNNTAFSCQELPMQEKNGANILRIILKAGYHILPDGELELAPAQPRIIMEDEYWGEPGVSSVRYESDIVLCKPKTDLLVNGQAWALKGRKVTQVDVRLIYQRRLLKHLRVFGDRVWTWGLISWSMTSPEYFESIPIIYERAYGGMDAKGSEARNRIGTGYSSRYDKSFEGTRAPNVELVRELVSSPRQAPMPAGLGVVSRSWEPRLSFAGTYDNAWLQQRFPLLPEDFDMCFNQSAHPNQWIERPHGGEEVVIEGMTPDGRLAFKLPPTDQVVTLNYRNTTEQQTMALDTILVEPDERMVTLTWRASADIHGDPFRLLEMVVGDAKPVMAADPCC